MSELLHELENNEAVLLMYIAGELPEEARREVEQMLQTDVRLREMYEQLRGSWDATMSALEALDAAKPLTASREAAARAVGRLVRQRHARRLETVSVESVPSRREFSVRLMLLSAAASLSAAVVGYLAWWGVFGDPFMGNNLDGRLVLERAPRTLVYGELDTSSDFVGLRPYDPLGLWSESIYIAETDLEHLVQLGSPRTWSPEP